MAAFEAILRTRQDLSASLVEPPQGKQISYASVLLALLIGVVHAGLAPVLQIWGVRPNILLVIVVLVTAARGLGTGISWAFVAGLVANLLTRAPLGSVPLTMLAVAAVVAAADRLLGRMWILVPVVAAFVGSVVADGIELGVLRLVDQAPSDGLPLPLVAAAAALNAALAAVLILPARRLFGRLDPEEGRAW
jgi:rod shape-determining protein MreD